MLRKIKNIFHLFQAIIANVMYGFPSRSLICIGVTGTDGKSTTANLIYHVLKEAKKQVGVISTVGCRINDEDYPVGFHTTTPNAFAMQKLLAVMKKCKCKYAVIEVASHGIDQKRIWGIKFKIAVLTNITHEHLDYHGSMAAYEKVKLKFMKGAGIALFNQKYYRSTGNTNQIVFTYGINQGDYRAENLALGKFLLVAPNGNYPIEHQLLGDFNVENVLAAYGVTVLLGINPPTVARAISIFKGISGRLERIDNDKKIHVFVDFAHTPNAVSQVLQTLRLEFPDSKIIHVFGATGKRDCEKRPVMGMISGKLADISILTTEDTYGETPLKIILMVENGIKKTEKIVNQTYFIAPERRKALELAIKMARAGDVVVATGVGHQTTLNIGHEISWSDKQVLKELLSC